MGILSGFNLLLCHYALGDSEGMKKAFQKMLQVQVQYEDDEKYTASAVCCFQLELELIAKGGFPLAAFFVRSDLHSWI